MSDVVVTSETRSDGALELVQQVLFEAATWDVKDRTVLPPMAVAVQHPELEIYHRGWGRTGDELVVAREGQNPVGGAYFRLFTDEEHGHGYVDPDTPELAIAVFDGSRGQGIGRRLMDRLEDVAVESGISSLALSVDVGNPAVGLYEKCGYELVDDDGKSLLMVKNLTENGLREN